VNRRAVLSGLLTAGAAWVCGRGAKLQAAALNIKPDPSCALIVVDVQNCFISGSLPIKDGAAVVPVINRIARGFQNVALTQDWHPLGHVSFASRYPGRKPLDSMPVSYGHQVLWPDHCVQGTEDAALARDLNVPQAELIIRKGFHQDVDSYSAFREADHQTSTGLEGYLKERGIRRLFVCGLATDFCVAQTALDARHAGFETYVIEDACRGVDFDASLARAWKAMTAAGVRRIQSTDLQLT
jgi:nicotinamidase/pyrazinamidase